MGAATYRSCEAVGSELFWNSDQNAYLCCFDYGHYEDVRVFPLDRGGFPLDRYLESRARMRDRHREGRISPNCRDCCRLREGSWSDDDSCRIEVLTLTHFKACNLACTFCGNRHLRTDPGIEEVDVRATLRDMAARRLLAPGARVMIAGGEPSVWPHLADVVETLLPHGVHFIVCTNAVEYMPVLERIWGEHGSVEVICGIHAASRATHRSLLGGRDVFDAVWGNLARYAKAGGASARGKMVLLPENAHEAEGFVDRCAEAGVQVVEVDCDNGVAVPGDEIFAAAARFYRRACDRGLRLTWGDRLLIVRAREAERWQRAFGDVCRIPGRRTLRVEHAGRSERARDSIVYLSHLDTRDSGLVPIERNLVSSEGTQATPDSVTPLGRSLMIPAPGSFVEVTVPEGAVRLAFISNPWSGRARIVLDGGEALTVDLYDDGPHSRLREVGVDVPRSSGPESRAGPELLPAPPEAQAEVSGSPDLAECFFYGLHAPESAGTGSSRWSRRRFGFVVSRPHVRAIRLDVYAPGRVTVRARPGLAPWETRVLEPGPQRLVFRIPEQADRTFANVDFVVDPVWRPGPQDPRTLGLRIETLEVESPAGRAVHPVESLRHNARRSDQARWGSLYRVEPSFEPLPNAWEANCRRNTEERSGGAVEVTSTPLKLYLEIAWLCGLRCPSCFHSRVSAREQTHFMSPALFRYIAETLLPGAFMVWFSGNGDSLLHPNVREILRSAQDHRFLPALLTSGASFDATNMRLLVEGGFFLSVSVDSSRRERFERLRLGASFDRVVAAIRHMQGLKDKLRNERFNIRLQCVAQQANLDELSDLVALASELRVEEIQFLPIQGFGRTDLEDSMLQRTPAEANDAMLRAVRTGTRLGVRVRPFPPLEDAAGRADASLFDEAVRANLAWPIRADRHYGNLGCLAEHPSNRSDRICHLPWSECFLGVDGTVAPCDMYLSETTVGNLYDDDFEAIWNGPAMIAMRRDINGRSASGLCAHGRCMFRPAPLRGPEGASGR